MRMVNKIYLGKVRNNFNKKDKYSCVGVNNLFLERHKWSCGWYWGFGYIGNKNFHTHMDRTFLSSITNIDEIFKESVYTQREWWIIRDLFIQAYALKSCAEVYRNGGYQTTEKGTTDLIKSKAMEKKINADLEKVLNKVWEFMTRDRSGISETSRRIAKLKERIAIQKSLKDPEKSKLEELEANLWNEERKIN